MAVRRSKPRYSDRRRFGSLTVMHLCGRSPTPPQSLHPLAVCLAAALGIANATPADGLIHPTGTIVVTNCADSGPGSVREAYAGAHDGDTVDLSALACSTITLTSGALRSAPDAGYVTLRGNRYTGPTINGNHTDRVLVHSGARIGLRYLAVTAGVARDALGGGCIYSSGDVALSDATVSGCEVSTSGSVAAKGGGIRATRAVYMGRSRVTGNRVHAAQADADGGGIHAQSVITGSQNTISGNIASGDGSHHARGGGVFANDYLRFADTTVSGNQAESGGGIYLGYSSPPVAPTLTNTTISGNHASGAAGGIFAGHSVNLYNSTVAQNTAVFDLGAGIYLAAGDVELHSTIVANNSSGDGLNAADIAGHTGAVITGAHNLVIASTLALPVDTLSSDPRLDPLADNDGIVQTHALQTGSPAIDAGENPRALGGDERGFVCPLAGQCVLTERTIGRATDIGAFESGVPDHIFADGFDPKDLDLQAAPPPAVDM